MKGGEGEGKGGGRREEVKTVPGTLLREGMNKCRSG